MISDIISFLRECGIKSISVGAIIGLIMGCAVLLYAGDSRYMQKTEGAQIQQLQKDKLKIEVLVLQMKIDGASQDKIDKALKKHYEGLLEELGDTD